VAQRADSSIEKTNACPLFLASYNMTLSGRERHLA
jgi:hypothetical protein